MGEGSLMSWRSSLRKTSAFGGDALLPPPPHRGPAAPVLQGVAGNKDTE